MKVDVAVKFLGGLASGDNLTGSCSLVTIRRGKNTVRFLIDAGMVQGKFRDNLKDNLDVLQKVDLSKVDHIILTHAHVDHVGRLPLFFKKGFRGSVICTEATGDLLPIMLLDTAKIQQSEIRYRERQYRRAGLQEKNRGGTKNGRKRGNRNGRGGSAGDRGEKKKIRRIVEKLEPLYTIDDAECSLSLVKNGGFGYHRWIKLDKGIHLKFYPSGHILGGAVCVIRITLPKLPDYCLGFSGDIGREDGVILPPPELPKEDIDCWTVESTYGDRNHPSRDEEKDKLFKIVLEAVKNGLRIIIPSFALERTQEIVYLLSRAMHEKVVPRIPIYLDSPMAIRITDVYARHWNSPMFVGQETLPFNPFSVEENSFLKPVTDDSDSVVLSKSGEPAVVIAGAGMCDAGRVRNHLRAGLSHDKTVVCLVGYMARDSLGRKLSDGWPIVSMNGQEIIVKAKIVSFQSLSAHADSNFLVNYTRSFVGNNNSWIFIVHGEKQSGLHLGYNLLRSFDQSYEGDIIVPGMNEEYKVCNI